MKVILKADVKKVGQKGSVVEVADGYGQNVLIARGLAVAAVGGSLKVAEASAAHAVVRASMSEALAKKTLTEIDGKIITIAAKANAQGGLFVAVREAQIVDAIAKQLKLEIPESAINLPEPIKKTGKYPATVSLSGARATLTILVSL